MKADPKKTHVARSFKHDAPLICCRFDPTGRYVFATGEDRSIVRWTLATESDDKVVMQRHDSWVRDLAFSKDGEVMISSGYDDRLIWWPATADKPEPIREVQAHQGWIRTVSVSPDGTLLASAGNDRLVKLWKVADGTQVREMEGHERDVYSTCFHPSGKFLLSGDLKGNVHQWEVETGKLTRTFDAKELNTYSDGQRVDYGGVRGVALSPDAKHLACTGLYKATNPLGAISQPLVLRFDWETRKTLRKHAAGVRGIGWRSLFHKDGYLIGCSGGGSGGWLHFWNAEEDKAFHKFKLPGTAREFDLHPDGIQMVTAHYEKRVHLTRMTEKPEGS